MHDLILEDDDRCTVTRMLEPRFTPRLLSELKERMEFLKEDTRPHLLTGIPGKPFSLGGDLGFFLDCIDQKDFTELYVYAETCAELVVEHYNLPQLTISYLQGDAFGGGLEAALASDVRLMLPSTNLGFPEARFGSFPGMGGFRMLSDLISPALAMDAIMSGYPLDGKALNLASIVHNEQQALWKIAYFHTGRIAQLKLAKKQNPLKLLDLRESIYEWTYVMMNLKHEQIEMIRKIYNRQRGAESV